MRARSRGRLWASGLAAIGASVGCSLGAVAAPPTSARTASPDAARTPVVVARRDQPVHVIAGNKASARILLDANTVPGLTEAALTELVALPGTHVPLHTHTTPEILYILSGEGDLLMDGASRKVRGGDAIHIPAGVRHGLMVKTKIAPLRALQVYAPGGAEQRFRKGTAVREE